MNTTFHKRIEENVRKVLDNIVPSVQILPNFLKDFLAKSFCNHATWKSSNSPERIFHEDASKSQTLCYSSSFPFWPGNDNSSFFHNLFQKSNANTGIVKHSITERALLEAHRNLLTCRQEPIIAALKLSRRETSPATLEATFFGSYIVRFCRSGAADRTAVQVRRSTSDNFFVTPIISKHNIYELEYAWLQRKGKAVSVESVLTTPIEVQVTQPVAAALMHAAIIGEGFHRRYVIDVKVLKHEGCGKATRNNTILLRVPISNTAYIDLDELRRMERFNELKLVSFTKHIEIERPSPVSAQHVIVLEFPMSGIPAGSCIILSLSNQIHIEYPIHFRYQAPSETESYRQAFVIAPDIFIKCLDKNPAARNKLKPIRDDVTWGISNQENWFSDSDWINLAAVSPLPALQISIPVGYLPSRWLVSYVTLMATIVSAAIIIWFSYREAYGVPKAWGKFEPSWKSKDN
ncbi:hypothetical protein CCR75_000964 [Bremia lactucae]|uniref:Phosphatidylinositol-glycan biosynthesis class X protein n=1 Tax=Bremia lactucae TaxID=4779 RepID=A0A976IEI6_BRELC|nr:hypothetical protein CCR75_000964 [Bremia lactucae]